MAVETAVGYLTEPEVALATALSNCDTFQTLTGAANAAAALASIYYDAMPEPANGAEEYTWSEFQAYLPAAIIYTSDTSGLSVRRDGVGAFVPSGVIVMQLDLLVTGDTDEERARWFKNRIGKIIRGFSGEQGLIDGSETAGYLNIQQVEVAYTTLMQIEAEGSQGFQRGLAVMNITWGVNG